MDTSTLSEFLSVLAYPARLELLGLLRFPHTLREIRLAPHKGPDGKAAPRADKAIGEALALGDGTERERSSSRQAIHAHLQKLVDADLVRTRPVEQAGRTVPQYMVNPAKFYALIEDLRRLNTIYAGRGLATDATGTLEQVAPPKPVEGPRLVLVHGVYEGKAFALDESTADPGPRWVLGRRRGLSVTLDYDPFVSLEHAVVTQRDGDFVLLDMPRSKNGTAVNWAMLPPGGERVLRPGDVIGLGRSLLSFVPR